MIPGYIFFQIILFSMLLWARAELLRFLREHTGIYDDAMLSKYKVVVRRNMLAALAFLVSGLILMAWGFYLSLKYGLTGFSIALVFSIPAFYLGFGPKKSSRAPEAWSAAIPPSRKNTNAFQRCGLKGLCRISERVYPA